MLPEDTTAARLAAIVESSDDAIVSKDLNGYVQSWNAAAERMFGYSASEMVGQHITVIIPRDRRAEEDHVLNEIRHGRRVEHFETVRCRKDGSLLDISLTVSPIMASDGRIVGASKIARDITERKQMERAAQEASRAKDEFLATLSHELRTPLNTVLGYTQMLQRGALTPDALARAVDAISRNGQALTRLVNDVLDASRVITGKMRLQTQPCDVGAILGEAVDTVRLAARGKSLDLQVTTGEGLIIEGDPDRLRQVFWNLLANAAKFTPPHGSIRVAAERRGEREIVVTVADTGLGITAESLPRVFERFWQADGTQTRGHGGLGLGLALVRSLVELHGGRVTARSEGVNRGATFEIVLPALLGPGRRQGPGREGAGAEENGEPGSRPAP